MLIIDYIPIIAWEAAADIPCLERVEGDDDMAQGGGRGEYAGDHVGEVELLAGHLGEHGEEAHGEAGEGARVREVLLDPCGELVEHLGGVSMWRSGIWETHAPRRRRA